MLQQLTREEILEFYTGITNTQNLSDKFPGDFTYALSRNRRKLKDAVECIDERRKDTLGDYNKDLRELGLKHATKDEKGKPIIRNNQVSFGNSLMDYNKEKDALEEKYKEVLDADKAFLKETEEIDVYMYSKDWPDGYGNLMDMLYPMRVEPVEKTEAE